MEAAASARANSHPTSSSNDETGKATSTSSQSASINAQPSSSIESRLKALDAFVSNPSSSQNATIPAELNDIINDIANIGSSRYPWNNLKVLLKSKLEEVLELYRKEKSKTTKIDGEDFETRHDRALKYISDFKRPPFTLQRMCELLKEPKRYYSNIEKFFLAFSKMVCGITYPAEDYDGERGGSKNEMKIEKTKEDTIESQKEKEDVAVSSPSEKKPNQEEELSTETTMATEQEPKQNEAKR
eukprot:jgi/Bigna1/141156/aug1.60_g15864